MSDHLIEVPGWSEWLATKSLISGKLRGVDRNNLEAFFLSLHAGTEALFRQVLFAGLRLNRVPYRDASEWLFHNDKTPNTKEYPKLFDRLYAIHKTTWASVISSVPGLDQTWDLWNQYSKVVRNHISHGIRKYKDEWLASAIRIDQELLIRLDMALTPLLGGSLASKLTNLNPRLPIGLPGVDLAKVTGCSKSRNARPKLSLINVEATLVALPNCWNLK